MGSRPPPANGPPAISETMKHIILGIVGACLVLILLSLIHSEPSADGGDDDTFLIAHTLDTNNEIDHNYASWGHEEWMSWLSRRNELHKEGKRRRNTKSKYPMDEKPINTVVIATPLQIMATFMGNLARYGSYPSELVWSNHRFPTYVFKLDHGRYRIYLCPPTYIAVLLVNRKPVHLGTFNTEKITTGNSNFKFKTRCRELQ